MSSRPTHRTLVLITHRPSVASKADYVIHLDGDGTVRMNP